MGGRTIKVDHVSDFKPPKSGEKDKFGNKLFLTPVNVLNGYQESELKSKSNIKESNKYTDKRKRTYKSEDKRRDKYKSSYKND